MPPGQCPVDMVQNSLDLPQMFVWFGSNVKHTWGYCSTQFSEPDLEEVEWNVS